MKQDILLENLWLLQFGRRLLGGLQDTEHQTQRQLPLLSLDNQDQAERPGLIQEISVISDSGFKFSTRVDSTMVESVEPTIATLHSVCNGRQLFTLFS